jgi:hypothetical protein
MHTLLPTTGFGSIDKNNMARERKLLKQHYAKTESVKK